MWSEEDKGHEVSTLLEDLALKYWEIVKETDKYDYEKIKKTVIKNSRAADSELKAVSKFYSLKQHPNESVDDYLYNLIKCKNDWPAADKKRFDNDIVQVFRTGLKIEIVRTIFRHTDFESLLKKAKEIENLLKRK